MSNGNGWNLKAISLVITIAVLFASVVGSWVGMSSGQAGLVKTHADDMKDNSIEHAEIQSVLKVTSDSTIRQEAKLDYQSKMLEETRVKVDDIDTGQRDIKEMIGRVETSLQYLKDR